MTSRIDGVVARLHGLHPRLIDLSLDRLRDLLARLGHPEQRLPPIVHVAGTNGKGSTCAFLRAIGEAAGMRVHVYTSPHLVRFNERIRLAGRLVDDEALAAALEHVEQVNAGAPITVFEVITAVALHLFAATPADLCVLEVGLGGRGDATNVVDQPLATAITSISLDHRELLGETLAIIAAEKAGILKPGVPVAIGTQPAEVMDVLIAHARRVGAPLHLRGQDWDIAPLPSASRPAEASPDSGAAALRYHDRLGTLDLPLPSLRGAHQFDNAGIAIAALRAVLPTLPGTAFPAARGIASMAGAELPTLHDTAIRTGLATASWPARLQRLTGRLAAKVPDGWELWLDGGHNPGAGIALAEQLRAWGDRPVHLVVGMKQAKDSAEFLRPLLAHAASVWAVAEPDQHLALPVEAIVAASGGVARPGSRVSDALASIAKQPGPARILICGSLYLAGEVLKQDQ